MAMISGQDPALTAPGRQRLAARAPSPNTLAVERALQLLFLVVEHQQGASLQQLARQVGCSKSTVVRLLATMERLNMVKREEGSRRYRLGRRARELSRQADERLDLRRVAQPHMQALRDATDGTVSLHVVDDDAHVIVEQCESRQEIRRILPLGQRVPLLVGATDDHAPGEQHGGGDELPRQHGVRPAAQVSRAEQELQDNRGLGYAYSLAERAPGSSAISAPILDLHGRVRAALTSPARPSASPPLAPCARRRHCWRRPVGSRQRSL